MYYHIWIVRNFDLEFATYTITEKYLPSCTINNVFCHNHPTSLLSFPVISTKSTGITNITGITTHHRHNTTPIHQWSLLISSSPSESSSLSPSILTHHLRILSNRQALRRSWRTSGPERFPWGVTPEESDSEGSPEIPQPEAFPHYSWRFPPYSVLRDYGHLIVHVFHISGSCWGVTFRFVLRRIDVVYFGDNTTRHSCYTMLQEFIIMSS